MKNFIFVAVVFLLSACADDSRDVVSGPNTGAAASSLADARSSLSDAQDELKSGKPDLKAVSKDLKNAQQAHVQVQNDLKKIQSDGDKQAVALAKSEKDKAYYRAIAENNVKLMLVSLLLGAGIFALGERGKSASPYTTLIPGLIAGMLATMIFAVIACSFYELWDTISWLFHFL